ncbi:MAG TPA: hypothetical protein VFP00_05860 [Burkholderiales bacterium]|nr:hypothetical protein [Burkholderiales bacterium]
MHPAKYYSQRQLSPYRGMLHVVDVGHALAYTVDGEHWRARLRSREGRLWPVGGWMDTAHRFTPADSAALMAAMNSRPPLPFPQADRIELWLLEKAKGQPLALLQTRTAAAASETPSDPVWRPLAADDTDFRAECLRPSAPPVPHRDVLARRINDAASPRPVAQWFARNGDGSGVGLTGMCVPQHWTGRTLEKNAFPEMLVSERWDDATTHELAREYHDWNAAALLTHLDLSPATRRRLEAAACRRPDKLLELFRLIPEFIDRTRLEIALVQARLMQTPAPAEV